MVKLFIRTERKEAIKLKEKNCIFSVKIIADVFSSDNILVDRVRFAQMVEATDFTKAFREVQKRIKQKAARRGYRQKNGYRFQYHIASPFKKIWETTAHLN